MEPIFPPHAILVDSATPHLFVATAERPVRAKCRRMEVNTVVVPHQHAWAQASFSPSGVVRVTTQSSTFVVPPSRAVWIPANVAHSVTVLEEADMRTLYFRADTPLPFCDPAWHHCRVMEVSDLLRSLVLAMDTRSDPVMLTEAQLRREQCLASLVMDELQNAQTVPLGLTMPSDKRLLAVCQRILDNPAQHSTLEDWAKDAGASSRTLARLFRLELNCSFGQWRQQALLAKALTLSARQLPMNRIAHELGYATSSAFSAMVRRELGQAPSQVFGKAQTR